MLEVTLAVCVTSRFELGKAVTLNEMYMPLCTSKL